jgi:hypothetical protein
VPDGGTKDRGDIGNTATPGGDGNGLTGAHTPGQLETGQLPVDFAGDVADTFGREDLANTEDVREFWHRGSPGWMWRYKFILPVRSIDGQCRF